MRILSQPSGPEQTGPRKRPRAGASDKLSLLERNLDAIGAVREYYENMSVGDWGKLPDPVKAFLQACTMNNSDEAIKLAGELAQALDEQKLLPDQVPLALRKAIAQMT